MMLPTEGAAINRAFSLGDRPNSRPIATTSRPTHCRMAWYQKRLAATSKAWRWRAWTSGGLVAVLVAATVYVLGGIDAREGRRVAPTMVRQGRINT